MATAAEIIQQKGKRVATTTPTIPTDNPKLASVLQKAKPVAAAPEATVPEETKPKRMTEKILGDGLGGALGAVGSAIVDSEKRFGETIGDAIFAPTAVRQVQESQAQLSDMQSRTIKRIKDKQAKGEDVSRLLKVLKDTGMEDTQVADLVPSVNKTNKQVLGEAAGVGLDVLTAGAVSSVAKAGKTARVLKGAAEGAALGGGFGAASAAQEDKSNRDIAKAAGAGAAVGGVLGAVPGALGGAGKVAAKAPQAATRAVVTRRRTALKEFLNQSPVTKKLYDRTLKKGSDVPDIIAQNDRYVPKVEDGKVLADEAIDAVQTDIEPMAEVVSEIIKAEKKGVSLEAFKQASLRSIQDLKLRGDEYNRVTNAIEKDFAVYEKQYGSKGTIPLEVVDQIKKAKYGEINWANVDQLSADRAISRAAKETIESNITDTDIRALNKELGKLYDVQDVLEKMQGRAVKGGRLGGGLARVVGAVAGSSGGVLGSIAGSMTAGQVAKILQTSRFNNPVVGAFAEKLQQERPELFKAAEKILKDKRTVRELPAPKGAGVIPLPEATIPAATPARKIPINKKKPAPPEDTGGTWQALGKVGKRIKQEIDTTIDIAKRDGERGFIRNPFAPKGKNAQKIAQLRETISMLNARKRRLLDQGLGETNAAVKSIIKSIKRAENEVFRLR